LTCDAYVGQVAENGVVITPAMASAAQVYVDDVVGIAQVHGALRTTYVEHKVFMPQVHATDNWGTLDAAIHVPDKKLLFVWDGKFGHREHKAFEKYQLIDYAAGIVNELGIDDREYTMILRIVQPNSYARSGPVDEWVAPLTDLRPYVNKMHAAAYAVPTFTSGEHCRDCRAVGRCETAKRAAYSLIDYVKEPPEISSMTGGDLAVERRILATGLTIAKARAQAIEDDLIYRVSQGATDTGLALESKRGNPAWSVPHGVAAAFGAQFGVDVEKPALLTPIQATAKAPKELRLAFGAALDAVTSRKPGGLSLISVDDSIGARAFKTTRKI
jgi:hypothetical protein